MHPSDLWAQLPAGFQLLAIVDPTGKIAYAGGCLPNCPDLQFISLPLPPLISDLSASASMPQLA